MPNTGLVPLLRRTYWLSIAAIAAIASTVIVVALAQRNSDRWTQHSREVVRLSRRAQLLALDRETGVRGFLLTGDSSSLAPEIAARVPLRAAVDSLVSGTADNPGQQRRARAFADAIARWDSTFVRPAIAQRLQQGTSAVGQTFGAGGLAGKVLFDDVRMRYDEFEGEEESLYRARSRLNGQLQFLEITVTLAGLLVLGGSQAMLRRRVGMQASALVERQGQLEEQATVLEEQASELEEQATELEEQASELEHQATELEAQTEALQDTVTELARKNDELSSFSSSVAHDLRSPRDWYRRRGSG